MFKIEGRALRFGDDVNTDYIISSRRKKDTIDPKELVPYFMEDIRPGFANEISSASVLVAGENFGCGSAMEVAAQIVRAAGINAILAKSFARSYYRNAINNGILPIQTDTSRICEGDMLSIEMSGEQILVVDHTSGYEAVCPAPSGNIRDILSAGGLVPFVINQKNKEEGTNGSKRKN